MDAVSRIAATGRRAATAALLALALLAGPLVSGSAAQDADANDTRFLAGPNAATMNAITPELLRSLTMLQIMGLAFRFDVLTLPFPQFSDGAAATEYAAAEGMVLSAASSTADGSSSWLDRVTAWSSVTYGNNQDEFPLTSFWSDSVTATVGGDVELAPEAIGGLFFSYTDSDTDTGFNGGGADMTSISLGPYINYRFSDLVSADMSVGYTFSDIDNRRTTAAGAKITGEQEQSGWFTTINTHLSHWIDNWGLGGRFGMLATQAHNNDYFDSTNTYVPGTDATLLQFQLEAQARYYLPEVWRKVSALPYLKATYNIDAIRNDIVTAAGNPQPANDNDEVVLGLGATLFGEGPISGGLDYARTFARSEFNSWSLTGRLTYKF